MKIKRAFYAMLVLMLLPFTVMAQPSIPSPALGTAVIAVSKFFDNNSGGYFAPTDETVELNLHCDNGSVSPDSVVVTPELGEYDQAFVVSNLGEGETATCTVTETPIEGYTAAYYCDSDPATGADDSCNALVNGPSADACVYNTISANTNEGGFPSAGSQALCEIFNYVDPVDVEITKVWEVFGQPGTNFSQGATIRVRCNAEIYGYDNKNGQWYGKHFQIGNGSYVDGVATVTAKVYPEWYPVVDGVQDTTMCYAVEDNVASAVEVDSDCGYQQAPAMSVAIGSPGVGCTITNTVFFEGIPTLNQYGMAIMALLMLGVGFVGFRRFV